MYSSQTDRLDRLTTTLLRKVAKKFQEKFNNVSNQRIF